MYPNVSGCIRLSFLGPGSSRIHPDTSIYSLKGNKPKFLIFLKQITFFSKIVGPPDPLVIPLVGELGGGGANFECRRPS